MTDELRAAALRFYLLVDLHQQLQSVANRATEQAAIEQEAQQLIERIQSLGGTIRDVPPRLWFQSPRPIVFLKSGLPVAPEHSRMDIERALSALIS